MVSSVVHLSEPLYEWEPSDRDKVTYDALNDRVVHQMCDGFFVIDLDKEGTARDGIFVPFQREGGFATSIKFSPDGCFFAYSINNTVAVVDGMHTDAVETSVPSLSSRTPTPSLLDFFWLPLTHADTLNSHGQHVHPEYANLVVVTTRTIEIFRFSFQSSDLTKMKTLHSNSYVCWHESKSGVLVTAQGDTTLQPFLLASKQPLKLPVLVLDKQTNTHTHTNTQTIVYLVI
eukprot:GHVR01110596.1.p1 GENE.GHVR01110596.1~~GHVR01110596.1.p1  ORF type:complete len:231 (+),score=51.99 GHVR01110596.1:57-749(+)